MKKARRKQELSENAKTVLDHLRYLYEEDREYSMIELEEIAEGVNLKKRETKAALKELVAADKVYVGSCGEYQAKGAIESVKWED